MVRRRNCFIPDLTAGIYRFFVGQYPPQGNNSNLSLVKITRCKTFYRAYHAQALSTSISPIFRLGTTSSTHAQLHFCYQPKAASHYNGRTLAILSSTPILLRMHFISSWLFFQHNTKNIAAILSAGVKHQFKIACQPTEIFDQLQVAALKSACCQRLQSQQCVQTHQRLPLPFAVITSSSCMLRTGIFLHIPSRRIRVAYNRYSKTYLVITQRSICKNSTAQHTSYSSDISPDYRAAAVGY
jgi:hypothetical protein